MGSEAIFPASFRLKRRQMDLPWTRWTLTVSVRRQSMTLWERPLAGVPWESRDSYIISTSRFGIGQRENSFRTPLGLHRIARKIGGGYPIGTVFKHRVPTGYTWQGQPEATIVHRILWLEGLEPGFNRVGQVDTFRRYIYIHGFGDETTLGKPQSHGCIHVAGRDLLPLFDLLPVGTLVWIGKD